MANKYIDFTSNISVKLNGKTCSCPLVEIRSVGSDILQGCCYDEKAKCLTGQISDNPESTNGSNCITFWVACDEKDCRGGELVTRCFCDGNEDCGECETCGESGFCESRCAEGQFCDDDKCVDCLPGTCKNGKVCINGQCQCPKGSTEIDGVCRECDPDTFDVTCKICLDGKVVDVECPNGTCDPKTGECVDCVVSGNCTIDNECCGDNKCECCPGYTRDNCTGECVVLPANPCQDEGECGSCYSCTDYNPCTGFGTCTPTQCPSGFVCYEDDCIPKCDCDGVSTCGVTSYCKEVNAFDCGCVDCPSNSCIEGDGSCEGDSNRNCICNPATQRCEQDPCAGVICPAGSTCINGQCVKDDVPCNSDLSLEKIEDGTNCDLKGSVTLECCPCPIITVEVTPTVSGDTITFDAIYFKDGERLSNNLPTNNIAGNEEPSSGAISYITTVADRTEIVDDQGNVLSSRPIPGTNPGGAGQSMQFNSEVDNLQTTADSQGVPGAVLQTTANDDGTFTNVVRDKIKIEVYQEITIAPNGCRYEKQLLETFRLNSIEEFNSVQPFTAEIVSTDCRKPLFIWSRDDKPNFRKIYKDGANGVYEDILKGPEAIDPDNQQNLISDQGYLESCHTYTLEVDCDCAGPKTECIQFCDSIDNFEARSLNACNTQIEYTVPQVCDVNKNIIYRVTTSTGLSREYFGTQLLNSDLIEKIPLTLGSNPQEIEWVKLEMICPSGNCETCEKQIDFQTDTQPPNVTAECAGLNGQVTINVTGGSGILDVIDSNGQNYYGGSTNVDVNSLPQLTVRYGTAGNICKMEVLNYSTPPAQDCCNILSNATFNSSNVQCGGTGSVTLSTTQSGNISYALQGYSDQVSSSGSTSFTVNVPSAGTLSYTVTDLVTGCFDRGTVNITCVNIDNVTAIINSPNFICTGDTEQISVTPSGGSGNYTYSWTGPNGFTSSSSNILVSNSGLYTVTVTDSSLGGSTVISTNLSQGNQSQCGTDADVTINGPSKLCPNESSVLTASIDNMGPNPVYEWTGPNVPSGQGGPSININNAGTYSVTVTDSNGTVVSDTFIVSAQTTNCDDCDCTEATFNNCPSTILVNQGDILNWATPTTSGGSCPTNGVQSNIPSGIIQGGIANNPGTYIVTYTIDNFGCETSECSFNVIVQAPTCTNQPTLSAFTNPENCGNSQGSIVVSYTNADFLILTGPNSQTENVSGSGSYTFSNLTSGTYTIEVEGEDSACNSVVQSYFVANDCQTLGFCCNIGNGGCDPNNMVPEDQCTGPWSTVSCADACGQVTQGCDCQTGGFDCFNFCVNTLGAEGGSCESLNPADPNSNCTCDCEFI